METIGYSWETPAARDMEQRRRKMRGLSVDDVNDGLRVGMWLPADVEAFCLEWNESGKHFYHVTHCGGRVLLTDPPAREGSADA